VWRRHARVYVVFLTEPLKMSVLWNTHQGFSGTLPPRGVIGGELGKRQASPLWHRLNAPSSCNYTGYVPNLATL